MRPEEFAKAIAATGTTIVAAVIAALAGDNIVSSVEWVNVALLALGSLAVFYSPNVPGARYTKAIVAALTAAGVVLASAITDGVVLVEGLQMLVAALGALGVVAVPNAEQRTTHYN